MNVFMPKWSSSALKSLGTWWRERENEEMDILSYAKVELLGSEEPRNLVAECRYFWHAMLLEKWIK